MNKQLIVFGSVTGGIAVGFAAYILWKRSKGEDWVPAFIRDRLYPEADEEDEQYELIEDFPDEDDSINDPASFQENPIVNERPSYDDGKPPIGQVAAKLASERYIKAFDSKERIVRYDGKGKPISGRFPWDSVDTGLSEEEKAKAEKLANEVLEELANGVEEDVPEVVADETESEEKAEVAEEMPWDPGIEPISLDEFLNDEPFFDKISCVYFPNEDILAGGERMDVMHPEDTVGLKAIAMLKSSNDTKAIFVRCRQEGLDYQLYLAEEGLTYEDALKDATMPPEIPKG